MRFVVTTVLGLAMILGNVQAQSFGRNKVRYKQLDFAVTESPRFEIHHYLDNPQRLQQYASWCEHWYDMHQQVMKDTFQQKNPIILYNNHADFQQTTAISSMIGVGTGGVTEGLRNRVVLPFAMSNQQSYHVLGHELVHAFQYHKLINHPDTSISLKSIQNFPLWMVEGMAEHLSIGRIDAHTALWMRDAVHNEDLPSLKQLSGGEYFPYRYGQAFWAFVTGLYGDTIVEPLFINTAKYGLDAALDSVLNMGRENLSAAWHSALHTWYDPLLADREEAVYGQVILDDENAGEMNINPILSPDGQYVIFLSEKNLFTIDLFLADAQTGKLIRKISSTVRDEHLDNLDFIESAGTWSPEGGMFAFVAFKKGRNVLVIKDVRKGKSIAELPIPGVPAFSNPAWSPTGNQIVVSGLVEGQTDLYAFDWKTQAVQQLTDNPYAELHPHWSRDGRRLVFATDQLSQENGRLHGKWTHNLAILELENKQLQQLNLFPGADNLNPVFDNEGNIWFLSDREGFRDLYLYEERTGKVYQQTRLATGISGITPFAPAISVGGPADRVLYTHYNQRQYSIYSSAPEEFLYQEVSPAEVNFQAATLPPVIAGNPYLIDTLLSTVDQQPPLPDTSLHTHAYRQKLSLEYAGGNAGAGVGQRTIGTTTAMQGGIDLLFGDMLGNHKLYTGLALNGEIYDAAAQVTYLNQKGRIGWGATLSHLPYRAGSITFLGMDTLMISETTGILTGKYQFDIYRMFEERASAFAQLPLSINKRLEGGLSYSRFHYRVEQLINYYDYYGELVYQEKEKLEAPEGFGYFSIGSAFVHDNSFFGVAAPLQGKRYQLSAESYLGDLNFFSVVADYRQYFYVKPFSFSYRLMHLGRYGKDAETFAPLYLGNPWFVRGYNFGDAAILGKNQISYEQISGSKIVVGNVEVRMPFTGPRKLALIKSRLFLTDINLFFDGGIAWNDPADFSEANERIGMFETQARPIFSTGASLRINVLGAVVLEPYLAVPLQQKTQAIFGLNFIPGW